MRTIRWGMIGTGDVTEIKSAPALYSLPHSQLIGVTNRTRAKADSWVQRHGHGTVFPDAAALLADPRIDIVYIATPPGDHLALTRQAAAAGKHVYVEKPMALNSDECRAMQEACDAAGVLLFVAYYRRTLPRFEQVRHWIEDGRIGTVCTVAVTQRMRPGIDERDPATLPWRLRADVSGGGKLLDVGTHVIDVCMHWFGPMTAVQGSATNRGGLYDVEDTVVATWTHDSGVTGTGSWCFVAEDEADRIEIVGTAGSIDLAAFSARPLRLTTAAGVEEVHIADEQPVHQSLVATIIAELNDAGRCPSTGVTATATTLAVDAMLADFRRR